MILPSRILREALAPLLLLAVVLGSATRGDSQAQVVTIPDSDGTTAPDWVAIKGDAYDQRAHFAAGAAHLSAKLDDQIRLLKAKRAGMTTDLKDWDFAMKEVDTERALLTSRMTELSQATTPETWADAKDKFGEAWKASQLAVDKMHTTVTS
jgi:hypothetical protein